MKLFATSFWISCKHSSRRLLCLLCVLLSCVVLGWASFAVQPERAPRRAKVAVINLDENPMSRTALRSAASMRSLANMLEITFLEPGASPAGEYTAVVTIPNGFLDSVLNGENLSPLVEVNVTTPLEAMWVRQLAQAGAEYLTNAQLGVYTVQEGAEYGAKLDAAAYERLLMSVNLTFMRSFVDRLALLDTQLLTSSGALPLPLYYLAALVSILFFSYGFLYQPAVDDLRRFSAGFPGGKTRLALPLAAFAHVLALTITSALPPFFAACALRGFSPEKLGALALFALLAAAFALALSVAFSGRAACAAGCILSAFGMGLCAGCFLPLGLMPPVFGRIAPFLPAYQGLCLWEAMLGGMLERETVLLSFVMAALLLALSAFLWNKNMKGAGGG